MSMRRVGLPFFLAAVAGMGLWFLASIIAGKREAWDAQIYWVAAYPIAIGLASVLGFLFPERPWRWALALFLSQFVAMIIRNGELGNLWPLGMVLLVVLSVPAIVAGQLASWVRGKLTGQASS